MVNNFILKLLMFPINETTNATFKLSLLYIFIVSTRSQRKYGVCVNELQ